MKGMVNNLADLPGANGQREQFRVVGKPNLPGILSYAIATGVAKFGIDYVVPDMLHAKFLRSPYANARVVRVDTKKAWRFRALRISSPGKTRT
jgi:CO/xanthine dehydrogenase Mo-binding subunit